MEEPQSPKHQEETHYPTDPSAPIVENSKEEITKENKSDNKTYEPKQIEQKPIEITIKQENGKETHPKIANVIAFLSFLASAVMLYYTFMLFQQTKESTDAAIRSADYARTAIVQQRFNDSITQKRDSAQSIIDSTNTDKRFRNDSISLAAQINSLKETQRQFEKQNRAYLQVKPEFDIPAFLNTKKIVASHILYEIGNQPIRIDESSMGGRTWEDTSGVVSLLSEETIDMMKKFNFSAIVMQPNILYLTPGYPQQLQEGGFFYKVSEREYQGVLRRNRFVILFGKIGYTNLVTEKRFLYEYLIKIDILNNIDQWKYVFLYNEVRPIP